MANDHSNHSHEENQDVVQGKHPPAYEVVVLALGKPSFTNTRSDVGETTEEQSQCILDYEKLHSKWKHDLRKPCGV